MNLVKLTFRLHDGGQAVRFATTDQNVDGIEQVYLRIIPGAVMATRATVEKNIDPKRAAWLHQSQMIDAYSATLRKKSWSRRAGHYTPKKVAT